MVTIARHEISRKRRPQEVSSEQAILFCARLWCLCTGREFGSGILEGEPFRDFLARKGPDTPKITPLFDNRLYSTQIAWQGRDSNLVLHYCRYGLSAGLRPHVLLDDDFLLDQAGLDSFDRPPLLFYLEQAGDEISPHALFDPPLYRAAVGEAFLAGQQPVEAFIERWAERPARFSPFFSWRYYQLHEPVVRYGRVNPLIHFLSLDPERRHDPNPMFQRGWYRQNLPDQLKPMEPLVHFVRFGVRQGLMPNPFAAAELRAGSINPRSAPELLRSYVDTTVADQRSDSAEASEQAA